MTNEFLNTPKLELTVWVLTVGTSAVSILSLRNQLKSARLTAGSIKPGSTGPRIWTNLALLGQFGVFPVPQLVYWTATACNGFRQPQWMMEHALPSPPDAFGIDGVVAGRVVGLLVSHVGNIFMHTALKTLGDQFYPIGVREKPRLVDHGPFGYVRHPIYTGSIVLGASFALAVWSYIPLYTLLFAIGGCLLKMPIEEMTIAEDPVLGDQYKRYKTKVPYRLVPFIW